MAMASIVIIVILAIIDIASIATYYRYCYYYYYYHHYCVISIIIIIVIIAMATAIAIIARAPSSPGRPLSEECSLMCGFYLSFQQPTCQYHQKGNWCLLRLTHVVVCVCQVRLWNVGCWNDCKTTL